MKGNKQMEKFDPRQHFIDIKGKDYLPVAWRLVWFRQDHPDWTIETKPYHYDAEKSIVIFKAYIKNEAGQVIATAHKTEASALLPGPMKSEYFEKAETGSIGRALAMCGYGTQFDPEFDEADRIVDSPVETPVAKLMKQGMKQ